MPRDPEATQASILAAARVEFSAHGLAGARVDRIAARSGFNKERIYARFGDKEGLYQRVLAEMLEEMRLATVVKEGEDVGDYVRKAYDYLSEHRDLLRMLLWEALESDGEFVADEEARRRCYTRSNSALAEQIGLPAGPQSARLLFTLIGITAWPSAFATLGRLVTADDTASADGQHALREFLVDFARSGAQTMNSLITANIE